MNSTLAGALVAAKSSSLLGHVETGLRSRDRSMPEEINRIVTAPISNVLFAPSRDAVEKPNVRGLTEDRIFLVGNVMIDTLMANLDRAKARPILTTLGVSASVTSP